MRNRYKQLFLFLVVLIVPSLAITIQGRRIAAQEQEIAREEFQKRITEERKRIAAEIGRDVLARLERIKLQEMARVLAGTSYPGTYSDPAVAAVGWAEGGSLFWSWELDAAADNDKRQDEAAEADFRRAIEEAERAEFSDRRLDHAADFYRQAIATARTEKKRAAASLALARTLVNSSAQSAAIVIYRDLLKLPWNVTDDYGLPFASYAALKLVELPAAGRDVLDRAGRDLDSPGPLSPLQTSRLRSILEALLKLKDREINRAAEAAIERLAARAKDLDQARALQNEFSKLRVTEADWQAFRDSELWLIGRGPAAATARPLVVAVRAETVGRAVEAERLSRDSGPSFQIVAVGTSGELLNEHLPDMRVMFPLTADDQAASALSPQRSFWGFSFALVVMLTFLAGFLLWRDMRREVHLAELRTQFVSSVSHELKTPLTSIRMFAEILQMRRSTDPKMHDEYLETIVNESERLTRLLNNVLDFSRIERGQKSYRFEPTCLSDVIHAAVRTIQYPLSEQGFVLDLNVAEALPAVIADRDALQQATLNLLTNAMKYSGQSREIALRAAREQDTVLIEVSDRGIGIPDTEQSKIFEKFYRVPIPENRAISGTGLGLALVAHIVEAHGGHVRVKSRSGEGSTFSIRLPLKARGAA